MVKTIKKVTLVGLLALVAGTAGATLVVDTPAPVDPFSFTTIDGSYSVNGATADWISLAYDYTNPSGYPIGKMERKDIPTPLLTVSPGDALTYGGNYGDGSPVVTWTDGTPDAAGSNNHFWHLGQYGVITITAPAPAADATNTVYVFFGCWGGANQGSVTAEVSGGNGSYDSGPLPYGAMVLFQFDYSGGALTASITSGGYENSPKWKGAALILGESTEIPEPATLLLIGTGALGVFGYARRRMMK